MSATDTKLQPGMVLAERYQLIEEVGRGGFGMVYRARQLNMDRDVALKILPPKFMAVSDVVERFKREARLASRLRHPNTITVHDYGSHENLLFIVMELLEGEDLADVLARQRTVEMERILHIGRQALQSLHEAHSQQIIHRDLKPENIFLTRMGEDHDFVKVLDFGIAKLAMPEAAGAQPGRKLTLSGSTVGTPTYMSPEQAAGDEVDPLSDLYALAVILYETACGKPPFYDESAAKVMRAHLFTAVPKFAKAPLRDSRFEAVLLKALSKEKADRYPSAQAFLEALSPSAAEMLSPAFDEEDPPTTEFLGLDSHSEGLENAAPKRGIASSPDFRTSAVGSHGVREKRTTESMLRALEIGADAAQTSARRVTDDSAIPFDSLPEFPQRARVQEAEASSRSNRISGLDDAFTDAPPPGFVSTPVSSSIITALDPEPNEVILLTQKKADTPPPSAARPELRPPQASEPTAQVPQGPPPSKRAKRQTFSGEFNAASASEADVDADWTWEAPQDEFDSFGAMPQQRNSRTALIAGALLILAILALAALQAAGIIKLF
ncbi:serine/threonine-protein kinase [Bradymonas sediminis]|uniref:Uncharacterized protein n=1 Tax=Bradymonas sediminis TaxID=1548548 RepID=A0A2Z4FIX2_9DELT|nr:serine/threonine-protein kinase [Bradymonas sediminis]AWV88596.1 hypothetical protein DN745_04295 [Bradymonas sediminis]TDP77742.1 serine/threonine protein kinase [Bradymonas sediminis]